MQQHPDPGTNRIAAVGNIAELHAFTSRRDFVRLMSLGGALVLLPSFVMGCEDGDNTGGITAPGSGTTVTIDFTKGDIAVLQFAYALEQLEADFYTQVVANFDASNLTAADKLVLADIHNHEVAHREFLNAVLAANASFTLTPLYPAVNFTDRTSVLTAARTFEELGVAAYNGASQYLTDGSNLLVAGKIVSVEARHASAIRDLIAPLSGQFAPTAFDDAIRPATVAERAQGSLVEKLALTGSIAAFVQGPNGNG